MHTDGCGKGSEVQLFPLLSVGIGDGGIRRAK